MKKKKSLLLAASLATSLLGGKVWAVQVSRINIEFAGGEAQQSSLEELVHATIATRVGTELVPATLSADIETLFRTGSFDDVKSKVDVGADNQVTVTYVLYPKKIVKEFLIVGNQAFSARNLRKQITHETGRILDDQVLAANRTAIMEKYKQAGYHGTLVTTRTEEREDGTINVVFAIQEAPRAKLKGVRFSGHTAFSDAELSGALLTRRQWWRYVLRFGNYFNEQLLIVDRDRLRELYATRGYLDFAVEEITFEYNADRTWVTPVYKVYEGPQYRLGALTVTGSKLFSAEQLLAKTTARSGDVYVSTQMNDDLSRMRQEYEQLGYVDLRYVPVLNRQREAATVDVEYRVEEGLPARVRDILTTGNEITQSKVILRELTILPGDLCDPGKIRISRQRLQNLNYFESVEILPLVTNSPDLRDLRIDLKEQPTGNISVGAGFSSEDSVMGFLEYTESNFDVRRLFDWPPKGAGQRFRTYVGIGSEVQNISISLTEPALFDRNLEWTNEFFLSSRFEDEYDERHIGFGSMLSWPVALMLPWNDGPDNNWRMGVGARFEHIRISNVDDPPVDFLDPDISQGHDFGDSLVHYDINEDDGGHFANRLIWRLTRDTRDRFRFPTRGSRLAFDAELVTAALGSYSNYGKLHLGGVKYVPVVQDFVLKMSLDGWFAEHFSGEDIRIFDRYFAGGYGTLRGFKRRDVSPVNLNDNPVGGLSMLASTFELVKPVKDFVYISVFTDIGNVWWDTFDVDPGDLNASLGIGLQFKALPIRLDYGYPVLTSGDHLDGANGRFHFNIGYSF